MKMHRLEEDGREEHLRVCQVSFVLTVELNAAVHEIQQGANDITDQILNRDTNGIFLHAEIRCGDAVDQIDGIRHRCQCVHEHFAS